MQHLSALDALLLDLDDAHEPRQVASLMVLEPGDPPLDHDALLSAIADRIDLVPRYRQVPRRPPMGVGMPVWADDENFDLALHVRRSALPAPGDQAALNDLVSRLMARRLDHDRPLWELYIIEGLAEGRTALLFKSHQALVDGSHTIDLAQVLLDETADLRPVPQDVWTPHKTPGWLDLTFESVGSQLSSPTQLKEAVRYRIDRVGAAFGRYRTERVSGPLTGTLSPYRRFSTLRLSLDTLRRVRDQHGGTVNDVILATIAGGLRGWLLTRAERLDTHDSFRALVPLTIIADSEISENGAILPTSHGTKIVGNVLSLPVGEPNAIVRLHQVSYALKGHRETGSAVAANRLAGLSGFSTSSYHAVAARLAETQSMRAHQFLVTNVPGPQSALYLAGQRVLEVYPVLPLTGGRLLSIGINSYDGQVFVGLAGDRDQMADLDVLAQCIREAADELLDSPSAVGRAPRGGRA